MPSLRQKELRVETEPIAPPEPDEVVIRVIRDGIRGSDPHYYLDGGFGLIRVQEPLIIGHQFAGYVEQRGRNVNHFSELAGAEPLAVCLHAARQGGGLQSNRVLVNGAGPLGALCLAVARYLGAEEIVAIDFNARPFSKSFLARAHRNNPSK